MLFQFSPSHRSNTLGPFQGPTPYSSNLQWSFSIEQSGQGPIRRHLLPLPLLLLHSLMLFAPDPLHNIIQCLSQGQGPTTTIITVVLRYLGSGLGQDPSANS